MFLGELHQYLVFIHNILQRLSKYNSFSNWNWAHDSWVWRDRFWASHVPYKWCLLPESHSRVWWSCSILWFNMLAFLFFLLVPAIFKTINTTSVVKLVMCLQISAFLLWRWPKQTCSSLYQSGQEDFRIADMSWIMCTWWLRYACSIVICFPTLHENKYARDTTL